VLVKVGRESFGPLPYAGSFPCGGFAQCSVGSTGSRCGRKLPFASLRSLIHLIRTGRFHFDSIVREGALWISSPFLLADLMAPYPQTVVFGISAGRICCSNCFIEIS
jgi:hypothetical protein